MKNEFFSKSLWRITFSIWRKHDRKNGNVTLALGSHLMLMYGYSDSNSHGTEKPGEPWNKEMIRGWKWRFIKLAHESAGASYRLILYSPSGAWRYWDVYLTVTRRFKTTRELLRSWID